MQEGGYARKVGDQGIAANCSGTQHRLIVLPIAKGVLYCQLGFPDAPQSAESLGLVQGDGPPVGEVGPQLLEEGLAAGKKRRTLVRDIPECRRAFKSV